MSTTFVFKFQFEIHYYDLYMFLTGMFQPACDLPLVLINLARKLV